MPGIAVIGGQWGDEGKGKIIDYLAEKTQYVVRYSGGNNAGHTVINSKGEFALNLIPSGIFWNNVTPVIGNGLVVDPEVVITEIFALQERGIDTERLIISDRSHAIMPYHILLDLLEEESKGNDAIGTTGKGVGPAYVDKISRIGIRMGEIANLHKDPSSIEGFVEKLTSILYIKNNIITKIYNSNPIELEPLIEQCKVWGAKLSKYVYQTDHILHDALERGENVLFEGAQGALLDIDHGTYPFVTSSSPTIGGVFTGTGVPFNAINEVVGVFKAYCSRVGSGPMVTELHDEVAEFIRETAKEYGTTTGRARRVGWFDAVAARYSAQINGFTSIVLTRLDVLDGFDELKICNKYSFGDKIISDFPTDNATLSKCEPLYETLQGWHDPTASMTCLDTFPTKALEYVKKLEDYIGVPIKIISTGPQREQTVLVQSFVNEI
jgi:adenylosuccinate synthase